MKTLKPTTWAIVGLLIAGLVVTTFAVLSSAMPTQTSTMNNAYGGMTGGMHNGGGMMGGTTGGMMNETQGGMMSGTQGGYGNYTMHDGFSNFTMHEDHHNYTTSNETTGSTTQSHGCH